MVWDTTSKRIVDGAEECPVRRFPEVKRPRVNALTSNLDDNGLPWDIQCRQGSLSFLTNPAQRVYAYLNTALGFVQVGRGDAGDFPDVH